LEKNKLLALIFLVHHDNRVLRSTCYHDSAATATKNNFLQHVAAHSVEVCYYDTSVSPSVYLSHK